MRRKERQLFLTTDDEAIDLPTVVRESANELMGRLLLRVLGLDAHEASDDAANREEQNHDPRS
jgi:hypothetical protein